MFYEVSCLFVSHCSHQWPFPGLEMGVGNDELKTGRFRLKGNCEHHLVKKQIFS